MQCASSVLTYDRLSLLNLEEISNKLFYQAMSSPHYAPPPLLLSIPDCLRHWPCSLPARRRRRRRGRRGGLAIKLKRFLRLHREPQLQLGFHAEGLAGKRFIRWRSLEPVHGWIISVFPTSAAPLPVIHSPRFWRGGVCTDHLRSLPRANSFDLGKRFKLGQKKFDRQINSVVKSSFFQLRLLSKAKPFLSFKNLEKVIHAFITSKLDYSNSLYTGISQTASSRLQLVQNAAARLLTRSHKRDHITPVLQSLHWLPARYRVDFKILLIVYKSLNGMAPYISDLLIEHNVTRSLRSSNQRLLFIPKTRRKCRGDRAFATAAPRLWNDLPLSIRMASSVDIFKSKLKTYLFDKAFYPGWSTMFFMFFVACLWCFWCMLKCISVLFVFFCVTAVFSYFL